MRASLSRGATTLSTSPTRPAAVSHVTGRSSSARTTVAAACSAVMLGRLSYASVGTTIAVRTSAKRMLVKVTPSA